MIFERKIGEVSTQDDPERMVNAYVNPTNIEVSLILKQHGELKGSLLTNGNIVVWGTSYGYHAEHDTALPELNIGDDEVLFNFYYTNENVRIPPLDMFFHIGGENVIGPFIWLSMSNDGYGYDKASPNFKQSTVDGLLKRLPNTKWIFFRNKVFNVKTRSVRGFSTGKMVIQWAKETGEYRDDI